MTAPIIIQIMRAGFLILLWLFVFAVLRVMRADLFGAGQSRVVAVPPRTKVARPPSKPKKRGKSARVMVVTAGSLAGTRITLGEHPVTIGRSNDSTLVLTDDYTSSRHARLIRREEGWFLEDLGSTNGTYLDRVKVTAPTLVPLGVPVRIGKTVLELHS